MSRQYDPTRRLQKIPDACRTTGLSQYYLRKGCKDGSIPHVKSGNNYLINIPLLIEQLDEKSMSAVHN